MGGSSFHSENNTENVLSSGLGFLEYFLALQCT